MHGAVSAAAECTLLALCWHCAVVPSRAQCQALTSCKAETAVPTLPVRTTAASAAGASCELCTAIVNMARVLCIGVLSDIVLHRVATPYRHACATTHLQPAHLTRLTHKCDAERGCRDDITRSCVCLHLSIKLHRTSTWDSGGQRADPYSCAALTMAASLSVASMSCSCKAPCSKSTVNRVPWLPSGRRCVWESSCTSI